MADSFVVQLAEQGGPLHGKRRLHGCKPTRGSAIFVAATEEAFAYNQAMPQWREMDCGPACVRMLATAISGKDVGQPVCDSICRLMPGRCVMTGELTKALGQLLPTDRAQINFVTSLAKQKDNRRGCQATNYYERYGPRGRCRASAFQKAMHGLGIGVRAGEVSMGEVVDFFENAEEPMPRRAILTLLNWHEIDSIGTVDSYYGHYCVVVWATSESVVLYNPDPCLRPVQSEVAGVRHQARETIMTATAFDKARRSAGTCGDVVFIRWSDVQESSVQTQDDVKRDAGTEFLQYSMKGLDENTQDTGKSFKELVARIYTGEVAAVSGLLHVGVSVQLNDICDVAPLNVAAWQGHSAIVELLLQHRASVLARDFVGATALWYAAEVGADDCVRILLNVPSEIDMPDGDGRTPLWIACKHGRASAVSLLVQAQANVNKQSRMLVTPLAIAAARGHSEIVQVLLAAMADAEAQNLHRMTALSIAASHGRLDVVMQLVRGHADADASASDGQCAIDFALAMRHSEVVEFLCAW